MQTERFTQSLDVLMSVGETDSAAFSYKQAACGVFIVPEELTATSVSFKAAESLDGDFAAVYNSSNTLVSITVAAGRAYPLPSELAGAGAVKFVGNAEQGVEGSSSGDSSETATFTVITKS